MLLCIALILLYFSFFLLLLFLLLLLLHLLLLLMLMSPIAEWLPPCMECLPSSPKAAIKAWQKQNKKRTHAHNTTNNNKKHRWRCYATAHMQNNFQADYCRWWCCSDWWCLTDRRWVCAKQVGGCQLSVVVVVVVIIVVFFWRQPIVGVLCQRGITLDSRWQKINKKKKTK